MIEKAINRLDFLCKIIPDLLRSIEKSALNEKTSSEKWSKKEIIGHLIDSATNNHQRFIRTQFENRPKISYSQNDWTKYNFYQQIDSNQIIGFWTIYNKQLIELFKKIPNENLQLECLVGENYLTLEYLINDYVEHLEHHLKQIVTY